MRNSLIVLNRNPDNRMQSFAEYEEFKHAWLEDVLADNPDSSTKGHRFASKLISQWLNLDEDDPAIHPCDGSGDGGIDIAVLDGAGRIEAGDDETTIDRWLLVQSKYGRAFCGTRTILEEGRKVLDTLRGHNTHLSSISSELRSRISQFREDAGSNDRIVLVYATTDELTTEEKIAIRIIEAEGQKDLGDLFETDSVSVHTVYERHLARDEVRTRIKIESRMRDLVTISSVKISNYFSFLEEYVKKTNDIDRLFERNIRNFLPRSRINQRLTDTLDTSPSNFGLYNNGITIVCLSSYQLQGNQRVLINPSVVNGCQTTMTIWKVCNRRLRSGGSNPSEETNKWKKELNAAELPIKVVRIKAGDLVSLREITRYTNTQNAIREKDFLALTDDFITWASEMDRNYNIFLEIQRGGWDARIASQRKNSLLKQLKEVARASDLLKVLGSCWLRYPGLAFSKNHPFLPGGSVFKEMSPPNQSAAISAKDLFAAYKLQNASQMRGFGRAAVKQSRGATKFLYYYVVGELIRRVLRARNKAEELDCLTDALLSISEDQAGDRFFEGCANIIDRYLEPTRPQSITREVGFDQNLNSYLKSETLGRDLTRHPHLSYHMDIQESTWTEQGFWDQLGDLVIEAPLGGHRC